MSTQPVDGRDAQANSSTTHLVATANGLGTAGMVLGIVGAVICLVPVVGFLLGLLATIFGGIGLTKANRGEATKGDGDRGARARHHHDGGVAGLDRHSRSECGHLSLTRFALAGGPTHAGTGPTGHDR